MNTIKDKKSIKLIKDALYNQIQECDEYPFIYSVIQFGFYDNQGYKLPYEIISKYWNKLEVEKTCKLIYNILKEHFGMTGIWMFIERHKPELDKYGEILKEGRFHINIITSAIQDRVIEEPNRKIRQLMLENGKLGIPIKDNTYYDIDELKIELFNTACRKANWVNRYKYSIKTQILDEPPDLENIVIYCLKNWNGKNTHRNGELIDFTDIVVFKASDFIAK